MGSDSFLSYTFDLESAYKKKNKEIKKLKEDYELKISELENRLYWSEDNKDRFMDHLSIIAQVFDIDWSDGDFPIKEFLEKVVEIIP